MLLKMTIQFCSVVVSLVPLTIKLYPSNKNNFDDQIFIISASILVQFFHYLINILIKKLLCYIQIDHLGITSHFDFDRS